MSSSLHHTFLLKKEDILDRRFTNPRDFDVFVTVQNHSYFMDGHPCSGRFPKKWSSWDEAKKDILTNGIKEPIGVKPIVTGSGKKYEIVSNSMVLAAAMLAGLNEYLAIEVT